MMKPTTMFIMLVTALAVLIPSRAFIAPMQGAAAAHILSTTPLNPEHLLTGSQPMSTNLVLAVKETREGIYGSYTVDVDTSKKQDMGESTFKKKEETEEGRDKYVSVLGILLVGSFVIPMVQYWWYIRDDDRPID